MKTTIFDKTPGQHTVTYLAQNQDNESLQDTGATYINIIYLAQNQDNEVLQDTEATYSHISGSESRQRDFTRHQG